MAATALFSIHVAKPSLSQILSHHFIVTRSPNHWCAISCVMSRATIFLGVEGRRFRVDQQEGLAEGDSAKVFHGAGLEVRYADEVELLERIVNAEVSVVVMQGEFGDVKGEGCESNLIGGGADAKIHAVLFSAQALEVADQEGDQIGGHPRGGEET